jgi:phosphoribosylformylglycinamidine cyclo-ligase
VLRSLEQFDVSAMAHITGGGLVGNVPRVLPDGCRAVIRRGTWRPPPVFATLQGAGRVDDAEMFRTFNMGIGYVLIVPAVQVDGLKALLEREGERVAVIGEVVAGPRGVELVQ